MTTRLKRLLVSVEALDPGLAAELREELEKPAVLWPEGLMEAVAEHVSASVWNPESQTFKSLDRRIAWAVGVWMDRYGPMTDGQRDYMASVLIWAVKQAADESGGDKRKLYSFLNQNVSNLVNHDTVAAGFKRRAARELDIREELGRMVGPLVAA